MGQEITLRDAVASVVDQLEEGKREAYAECQTHTVRGSGDGDIKVVARAKREGKGIDKLEWEKYA